MPIYFYISLMGKLILWVGIILIAIPIVRYLLSFIREYVKLITSNPKELFYRIKDGWKKLKENLETTYEAFIYSFKRIRKAGQIQHIDRKAVDVVVGEMLVLLPQNSMVDASPLKKMVKSTHTTPPATSTLVKAVPAFSFW